jgi:membrane associated rhomboid family serine protease
MKTDWQNIDLPLHQESHWSLRRRNKTVEIDENRLKSLIEKWQPQNPILIGVPGADNFQIPVTIPEYSIQIRKSLHRRNNRLGFGFLTLAIFMLVLGLAIWSSRPFIVALSCTFFAAAFFWEANRFWNSDASIIDRAKFFYWLHHADYPRHGFTLYCAITLLIGGQQLVWSWLLGGQVAVFSSYGAIYSAIDSGEFWRLISGSFLHYSVLHYSVNALLLILSGTLAWIVMGYGSLVVFTFGCFSSTYFQYEFGGRLFESYGGMSGGVFALVGLLAMSLLLRKGIFPEGFINTIVLLVCAGGIYSAGLSENTANLAHLTGFATGALAFRLAQLPKNQSELSGTNSRQEN